MSTWNELLTEFQQLGGTAQQEWFKRRLDQGIADIATLRGDRNVLVYFSGFLQKSEVRPQYIIMVPEDVNGVMAAFKGMDWDRGLTVVLHTPGGATMAVQTIVDYVHSKFQDVEIIVPAFAMSAGTMWCLASDRIVMGHQSQIGPIDPQLSVNGFQHSARAIVEQFEEAQRAIVGDPANNMPPNPLAAHLWAPILGSLGPSLLQFAQDQLDFSESMVARWLADHMLKGAGDPQAEGERIAHYFNDASKHKSHSKRIGIAEALAEGVTIEQLEGNQALQEAVLTLYHVLTILAEQTTVTKVISSSAGGGWIKNLVPEAT